MSRPRVLFVTQRFFLPMDSGGLVRTGNMIRSLKRRWDVTVVGHYNEAANGALRRELEGFVHRYVPIPTTEVRRGSIGWYWRVFRLLWTSQPVSVGSDVCSRLQQAIEKELKTGGYDLVVCDFVHAHVNMPEDPGCPAMLFTHNVETRIFRRLAENSRGIFQRLMWRQQFRRMQRFEGDALRKYDVIIAVSESDRDEFRALYGLDNVHAIATGVDSRIRPQSGPDPHTIVFCGSMNWHANQAGVRWFVRDVFPLVRQEVPNARLLVVGRTPPESLVKSLRDTDASVEFTGYVTDVKPYVEKGACSIIPLHVCGGTRLKAFEAMSLERVVVSTSVGIEGLGLIPDEHYLEADSAEEFARQVIGCLKDPLFRERMARNAAGFVRANFSWDRVTDRFAEIGESVMNGAGVFSGTVGQPLTRESSSE